MSLMGMWTVGKTFVTAYRSWFIVGSVVAVFALIAGHLALDKIRSAKLEAAEQTSVLLQEENVRLEAQALLMRQQIKAMNTAQLEALAKAAERIKLAEDRAALVAAERDAINEELEITRFETVEAIRDDEDFADWVDMPVPAAGWELLRNAAHGRD